MSAASALLAGCSAPLLKARCPLRRPQPQASSPTTEDGHSEQVWDGVVRGGQQAAISAQTSSRVIELPYDVNDTVAEAP
ncbi:MAG: hypothetical protein IPP82_09890 [Xanthomonadales bacterium]|nr:hypothetical protein [Xanthomonadales bacterium]